MKFSAVYQALGANLAGSYRRYFPVTATKCNYCNDTSKEADELKCRTSGGLGYL